MKCEICNQEHAHGTIIHEYHDGGVIEFSAACWDCGKETDRIAKINFSKYGNQVRYRYFDDRFVTNSTTNWDKFNQLRENAMWGE